MHNLIISQQYHIINCKVAKRRGLHGFQQKEENNYMT